MHFFSLCFSPSTYHQGRKIFQSIYFLCSALPYLSYFPFQSSPSFYHSSSSLLLLLTLSTCLKKHHSPRDFTEWENNLFSGFLSFFRIKTKEMGPFFYLKSFSVLVVSSVAFLRTVVTLNSTFWYKLLKQKADNSNYLLVASAPH